MSGLALEVAVNRWIKPQFETETSFTLDFDWRPTAALMRDIEGGARADMIIAISDAMDRLVADGIVLASTRTGLADSILGVGVKAGAAKPDVSTVEAFKRAMVGACRCLLAGRRERHLFRRADRKAGDCEGGQRACGRHPDGIHGREGGLGRG